jgi:hypothetical protein
MTYKFWKDFRECFPGILTGGDPGQLYAGMPEQQPDQLLAGVATGSEYGNAYLHVAYKSRK